MQTESVNIKRELEDDDREFNSVYNQNKEGKTANSECSPNNGYYQSSGQRQQLASSSSNHFVSLRKGRKIRKSSKIDMKAKLERSRQSARECRARKKLRYQYLEDLVAKREKAVLMLHKEIEMYRNWFKQIDEGIPAEEIIQETEKTKRKPEKS